MQLQLSADKTFNDRVCMLIDLEEAENECRHAIVAECCVCMLIDLGEAENECRHAIVAEC